jgi:hypothetical protein
VSLEGVSEAWWRNSTYHRLHHKLNDRFCLFVVDLYVKPKKKCYLYRNTAKEGNCRHDIITKTKTKKYVF